MSNARNISKAESRFVNATGDTVTGRIDVENGSTANPGIRVRGTNNSSTVNDGIGTGPWILLDNYSNGATEGYPKTGGVIFNAVNANQNYAVDSNKDYAYLKFKRTNSPTNNSTDIVLGTSYNDGDAIDRMTLDSVGRVTTPYQPGFKVAWQSRNATGSTRYISTSSGDAVATGRDEFNQGNYFSSSSGAFTAPVDGVYLFGFQGMRNASNGTQLECRFHKNGNRVWARAYRSEFNNVYEYWSLVSIIPLSTNDYVQAQLGGEVSIYNDDTYFYGYLLG